MTKFEWKDRNGQLFSKMDMLKGLSPLNSNFRLRSFHAEFRTPNLIHIEKVDRTKSIVIKSDSLLFRTSMFCHHHVASTESVNTGLEPVGVEA